MPEIQKNMNIVNTGIDGVVIIEPKVFGDDRGYFNPLGLATRAQAATVFMELREAILRSEQAS